MTNYIAILVEAQSGQWRALFPDVPGCEALGYGLANVKRAAAQNLKRYSKVQGGELRLPRTLREIEEDKGWLKNNDINFSDAVVVIVPWPQDPFSRERGAEFPIGE
jgi:predicted RNase H-like HicB family nuclease